MFKYWSVSYMTMNVAEAYFEESVANKSEICQKIFTSGSNSYVTVSLFVTITIIFRNELKWVLKNTVVLTNCNNVTIKIYVTVIFVSLW